MNDLPKSLIEFEERFATKDAYLTFAKGKKWPENSRCLKCAGRKSWPVASRRLEECQSRGHQQPVTASTPFHS